MSKLINLSNLCYYDLRNPDGVKDMIGLDIYDKDEEESFGEHFKPNCYCDNCFTGKTKLTEQLLEFEKELKLCHQHLQ